jgi:hypothetical protein
MNAGEISIVYLSPERFAAKPQIGIPIVQERHSLFIWLSTPSYADDKGAHGAWCPCALGGGAVKGGCGPVSLLVADVDECGAGAMDRSALVLEDYEGLIVPTFNATTGHEKHRIVLALSRPLDRDEFPIVWPFWCSALGDLGIALDKGCKNINRLYFACVSRSPATWLGSRALKGKPVDVDAMLVAARHDLAIEAAQANERKRRVPAPSPVQHRDRYLRGALDRARANVLASVEPGRHDTLLRESFSLARLELTEDEIGDTLLDAFVSVAGEPRRREGERAIRDACAARKGRAA